jgi:SAM-dependent methyltransferase
VRPGVQAVVDFYDEFAGTLASAYDRVSFEAVHGPLLHHLTAPPGAVLDVGAGSGRDANALESIGYDVTAVEPATALRELGSSRTENVRWIDDRLPELASLREDRSNFDFILCSAVMMNLAPEFIRPSFKTLARLLRRDGKLMVSVRPPGAGDVAGVLHDYSEAFLNGAAAAAGLKLIDFQSLTDAMGRKHRWKVFVYQHR